MIILVTTSLEMVGIWNHWFKFVLYVSFPFEGMDLLADFVAVDQIWKIIVVLAYELVILSSADESKSLYFWTVIASEFFLHFLLHSIVGH